MATFGKHWIETVSTVGSLIALWAGASGHGPGPSWVWIVVAYAAFAFAGFKVWLGEYRQRRRLEKYLQDEYEEYIATRFRSKNLTGSVIFGSEAGELAFYTDKWLGDAEVLKKAIASAKKKGRIKSDIP